MNKTLNEAASIISDRASLYGDSGMVHADIAAMWRVLLGCPVTAAQVMQCMIAVKLVRLKNATGGDGADSVIDIAGYAALLGNLISNAKSAALQAGVALSSLNISESTMKAAAAQSSAGLDFFTMGQRLRSGLL